MRRFMIELSDPVLYRLAACAEKERRDPRQQAAYLLERALGIIEDQPSLNPNRDAGLVLADTGVSH